MDFVNVLKSIETPVLDGVKASEHQGVIEQLYMIYPFESIVSNIANMLLYRDAFVSASLACVFDTDNKSAVKNTTDETTKKQQEHMVKSLKGYKKLFESNLKLLGEELYTDRFLVLRTLFFLDIVPLLEGTAKCHNLWGKEEDFDGGSTLNEKTKKALRKQFFYLVDFMKECESEENNLPLYDGILVLSGVINDIIKNVSYLKLSVTNENKTTDNKVFNFDNVMSDYALMSTATKIKESVELLDGMLNRFNFSDKNEEDFDDVLPLVDIAILSITKVTITDLIANSERGNFKVVKN